VFIANPVLSLVYCIDYKAEYSRTNYERCVESFDNISTSVNRLSKYYSLIAAIET